MTHAEFINKYRGKYVEYADASNRYQCVDLMRLYIKEVWGIDPYTVERGLTAKQIYLNSSTNSKIVKIDNTPNGIPQKGDLVFWGWYLGVTGWAGHVAVYDSGDLYNIISFDQNYPTYTPCHLQRHSYKGVMGWLRKRA